MFGGCLRKLPYLLFLVSPLLFADEVYLKGAGTLSGKILEETETMIKVDVGDGIIGVPPSRVERIVRGRSPLHEYDERASKLAPKDVKGWKALGHWALEQGLSKQSRDAYQKVMALAPDDAEARQVLGYVRLDGRWMTEEESYQAKGYVKYDNEWMTPAEAQAARAAVAADDARHEAELRANEAEIATRQAEARAEKAEKEKREAEERERQRAYNPVYWGGFGYGMNYWPAGTSVTYR